MASAIFWLFEPPTPTPVAHYHPEDPPEGPFINYLTLKSAFSMWFSAIFPGKIFTRLPIVPGTQDFSTLIIKISLKQLKPLSVWSLNKTHIDVNNNSRTMKITCTYAGEPYEVKFTLTKCEINAFEVLVNDTTNQPLFSKVRIVVERYLRLKWSIDANALRRAIFSKLFIS